MNFSAQGDGEAHFCDKNNPKLDGNDLSVVYWFIHEVCSLLFFFSSVTCVTFLTLIKQFEKVLIKTRQNDMRHLKNIL